MIAANLAWDSFDIASDMAEDFRVRVTRKRMMNAAVNIEAACTRDETHNAQVPGLLRSERTGVPDPVLDR